MPTPVDNLFIIVNIYALTSKNKQSYKQSLHKVTLLRIVLNISIAVLVDGGLTEWSEWGRCDQLCEPGRVRRHKTCTHPKRRCGGKQCDHDMATTEEKPCMYCPGKHL